MRLGATDPMRAARVVLFTSSLDGPAHLPDSVQHWHHFVILLDEIHTWPQAVDGRGAAMPSQKRGVRKLKRLPRLADID